MKKLKAFGLGAAIVLFVVLGFSSPASAQASALAIPGIEPAKDVPGARELPDPKVTYKVVFDIGKAADKIDQVNPDLKNAASFFNTLVKYGVPADHLKIAIVFHQKATPIIMTNDAFKARFDGHDNPNIALIQAMKKAGVDFRVCGQAVLANKIDPKTIQPEIELDLWALTTIVNMEMRGYAHIGN